MFTVAAALLLMNPPAPGQWTLDCGATVSFVFVQPSTKSVWRISGDPVQYASLPKPQMPVWSGTDEVPILVALLNYKAGGEPGPAVRFKMPATDELNASFSSPCRDKGIWMTGYKPASQPPERQDVAVGIADGPWTTVGWVDYRGNGGEVHAVSRHGLSFKFSLNGTSPQHTAGPFTMIESRDSAGGDTALRFVVKTRGGGAMPWVAANASPDNRGATNNVFQGDMREVSRVEMQTCRYQWHTLWAAHFKPNSR